MAGMKARFSVAARRRELSETGERANRGGAQSAEALGDVRVEQGLAVPS